MIFQLFKYGLVGIFNTAIFGVFCWLGNYLKWHYSAYTLLGYCISVFFSFTANFTFTFQSGCNKYASMAKFVIVSLGLILLAHLMQKMMIELLHITILFGILISMGVYTLTGFVINKYWVFGNKSMRSLWGCSSVRKTQIPSKITWVFPLMMSSAIFLSGCTAAIICAGEQAYSHIRGDLVGIIPDKLDNVYVASIHAVKEMDKYRTEEGKLTAINGIVSAYHIEGEKLTINLSKTEGDQTKIQIRIGVLGDKVRSVYVYDHICKNLQNLNSIKTPY